MGRAEGIESLYPVQATTTAGASDITRVATAFGLILAGLVIATGMLRLTNLGLILWHAYVPICFDMVRSNLSRGKALVPDGLNMTHPESAGTVGNRAKPFRARPAAVAASMLENGWQQYPRKHGSDTLV